MRAWNETWSAVVPLRPGWCVWVCWVGTGVNRFNVWGLATVPPYHQRNTAALQRCTHPTLPEVLDARRQEYFVILPLMHPVRVAVPGVMAMWDCGARHQLGHQAVAVAAWRWCGVCSWPASTRLTVLAGAGRWWWRWLAPLSWAPPAASCQPPADPPRWCTTARTMGCPSCSSLLRAREILFLCVAALGGCKLQESVHGAVFCGLQ